MLTSTEAGNRMGSRSRAPRNFAATAHRNNTLVAVRQGNSLVYPGFQFGPDGQPLAVIGRLRETAESYPAGLRLVSCSGCARRRRISTGIDP